MKKIVAGLVVVLGFCACAHRTSGTLDVNKALDYCAEQTQRFTGRTERRLGYRLYNDAT